MSDETTVSISFTPEELNLLLQAIQGAWKSGAVQNRTAAESVMALEDKLKNSIIE